MSEARYQTQRYVVHPDTTWEDVDRFAQSQHWPLVQEIPEDSDQGVDGQLIWQASDDVSLHYIEDVTSGIGYLVASGQDQAEVNELARLAADNVPVWRLDELFEAFDASQGVSRAQGAMRLGLAAPPEFDQNVFDRVSSTLSDEDPRVRLAALWATTYTGYRQFIPSVRELAQNEQKDWVRDRAASVLHAFQVEDNE